jgi:hypothetical protein
MYENFLQAIQNVDLGSGADNVAYPPVDEMIITTYHYSAANEYIGRDYAVVSLCGAEMIIAVIIVISFITFFIFRKKNV